MDSLDLSLIRSNLELPASVEVSEQHDSILDPTTWAAVLGPGSDGY